MRTKPLNEIIDECIEYNIQVDLGSELYCKFWRYRRFYDSSCDLLKIDNPNNKGLLVFRQLFNKYMNDKTFKA